MAAEGDFSVVATVTSAAVAVVAPCQTNCVSLVASIGICWAGVGVTAVDSAVVTISTVVDVILSVAVPTMVGDPAERAERAHKFVSHTPWLNGHAEQLVPSVYGFCPGVVTPLERSKRTDR